MTATHAAGDVVAGRYRVVRELGRGPAGITYEVERGGTRLALKQFVLASTRDPGILGRVAFELQRLALLDHPSVPAYLEHFTAATDGETCLYLARELAEGASLERWVTKGFRADESECRSMARRLLEVLAYLHDLDPPVVHRAVKPQNVIRDNHGRLALVDFGALRDALGQLRGRATAASDLYGLAETLLYALSGLAPGELPQKDQRAQVRGAVPVSDALATWLERMLEPAPEDRFASAREALAALEPGGAPKGARMARRGTPWRVAGLLGLLTIVGAAVTWFVRRAPELVRYSAASSRGRDPLPPRPTDTRFHVALRPIAHVPAHPGAVRALAVLPDGKALVTGADDGGMRVFRLPDLHLLRTFAGHHGRLQDVTVSPDGAVVASAGDGVSLWRYDDGTLVRAIGDDGQDVSVVRFTPDGKRLLTASAEGHADLWEAATGSHVLRFDAPGAKTHWAALDPSAKTLATGSADGTVRIFDVASSKLLRPIEAHGKSVNQVLFVPDPPQLLSAGDDRQVYAWSAAKGERLADLDVQPDEAWRMALSPDGRTLVGGGRHGDLFVWRQPGYELVQKSHFAGSGAAATTFGLAFLPDGRKLVSAHGDGAVRLWALGASADRHTALPRPSSSAGPEPAPPGPPAESTALVRVRDAIDGLELDIARGLVQAVLAANPRCAVAHAYLGGIVAEASRDRRKSGVDPAAAIEARRHFAAADALAPTLAETLVARATLATLEGDPVEGMRLAGEAERVDARSLRAKLALALAAEELGDFAAVETYASALLSGTTSSFLQMRGYALLARAYAENDDGEALAALHRMRAEVDPRDWRDLVKLSDAETRLERYADGVASAETAVARARNDDTVQRLASAHAQWGIHLLWDTRKPGTARGEIDRALAIAPAHAAALYALAAWHRRAAVEDGTKESLDEAETALGVILQKDATDASAITALAELRELRQTL